jgi:hypothetical protein
MPISAGAATCESCGCQDASHCRKPYHCARCLRIKQMFLDGMSRKEIGRGLGMVVDDVSYVLSHLEIRRLRIATCPVCGWQGMLAAHKPHQCVRYVQLRKMYTAGIAGPSIGRMLGITRAAVSLATHRLGITRPRRKVEHAP